MFRQLVLARIIEPVSKLDSLRVLEEAGITPVSYATLRRRMPAYAKEPWRQGLSAACSAHAGRQGKRTRRKTGTAPLVDSYLLADRNGFPLMVSAFEGNRAETKTMLPVIEAFMAAHQLPDVTVVADAGMISEANQKAIERSTLPDMRFR